MRPISNEQLKELLLSEGVVSAEDFDAATRDALRLGGQDAASVLVSRGIISWDYFYSLLAKFLAVPRANLVAQNIAEEILGLLPEEIAREKKAIVFGRSNDKILVAMEDPTDLQTIDFLKQYLRAEVEVYLATEDDLNKGFRFYGKKSTEDFRTIIEENIRASLNLKGAEAEEAAAQLPIVSIVDNLLSYAVNSRASDVHLEILEEDFLVRYRIDGILREIIKLPKEIYPAIVARIKILSGLKLDEHARPQDGRFRFKVGVASVDARVSILPTLYGEKAAMRILPTTQRPLSFEEVGMMPDIVGIVAENLRKAYGMILITGPTGSGKTTTLYTMVSVLNKPEVNISTIEDPIEFGIPNVNQTQINPAAGLTFAEGLRTLVRQDPNVIMVGEIRDRDTAEIAVHLALTGSLILSTLHTNDAATAIPRLIDIGVQPFLVAAVLNLIIAQRLVRRICLDCIVSYKPDEATSKVIRDQFEAMGFSSAPKLPKVLYKGEGCALCGGSGYKGRVGIFEALKITEGIQKIIVSPDFTLGALQEAAKKEGMITMFEDGLRKAERGLTTIEEVLRVIRE